MRCVNKTKRICCIIDSYFPEDQSVYRKDLEKVEKDQNLKSELQKLWNVRADVIPVITEKLETICEKLVKYVRNFNIHNNISSLQKIIFLGECFILRRVLDNSNTWSEMCQMLFVKDSNNNNTNDYNNAG